MDRRWLSCINEGMGGMYLLDMRCSLTRRFGVTGVFGRTWRAYTRWDGKMPSISHWILHPCLMKRTWYNDCQEAWGTSQPLSPKSTDLYRHWHTKKETATPASALYDPLHKTHLSLWCAKWTLLVNYRIQVHWGSQRALAAIKSLAGSRTDAHHKSMSG